MHPITLEAMVNAANDAVQDAPAEQREALLLGLRRTILVGVADLNHVEADGRSERAIVQLLLEAL